MHDLVTLGPWLRRFLCEHIVTERNLARNTRKSYRDTFWLLLPRSRKLRKPVDRLAVAISHPGMCCSSSRISRRNAGVPPRPAISGLPRSGRSPASSRSRDSAHVEWCGHIRSIASKKSMPPPVGWLTRAEMEAMLAVPDRKTRRGRSEYALLLFLTTPGRAGLRSHAVEGARSADRARQRRARSCRPAREGRQVAPVSAMAGNRTRPRRRDHRSRGRGRRVRQPARDAVHPVRGLSAYRTLRGPSAGTGWTDDNPACDPAYDGLPSVLAGVDINTVRAWLGHVSISTTNIYAEIDLTLKARAVALCEVGQPRPGRSWKEDKDLMAFLKTL